MNRYVICQVIIIVSDNRLLSHLSINLINEK